MRLAVCLGIAVLLGSVAAQAEDPSTPASENGIVYRLSDAEKSALLDRLADRPVAEPSQSTGKPRRSKAERIGLGILGYLGSAAADTSVYRRCGGSLQCEESSGTLVSANTRITP